MDRKLIYAHSSFVEPMLDYIITDFAKSRGALNDDTIGSMVICNSSEQAKKMFALFNAQYAETPIKTNEEFPIAHAAEPEALYLSTNKKVGKSKTPKVPL
ncbi:hypothetical protein [Arsenophonus endosymbiont of Aleurodicus floccissimus]|uniref:hypothetical protein n=1 Tax=Arsenophonus endosymbiont of Aleurodicus floccissimus TaxID=2152761 RepID=UPI001EDEF528|nr:hypothetical protein [Arsenophonus endosymbiont of Aleurodicus floccissimus]